MTDTNLLTPYASTDPAPLLEDRTASAVSWGAVIAGGVAAAAFSVILLMLGTGLGLSSISPWTSRAENAGRFGVAAVVWICVMQILSSGLGGYLAGRLRRRWTSLHVDETYFRDTAHGFLSWAVATLAVAALMTSVAVGIARSAAEPAAQTMANAASGPARRGDAEVALKAWPMGYLVDGLFRQPSNNGLPASNPSGNRPPRDEVARIFMNALASGGALSPDDDHYAGQLVAGYTGLSQGLAQARVSTTYMTLQQKVASLDAATKEAADRARKAAAEATLWLFVGLLMGAFSSSLLAIFGGRERDL